MPLFLLVALRLEEAVVETALDIALRHFPELAIEYRFTPRKQWCADVWVCNAPSQHHVERWADACRLERHEVYQVDITSRRTRPSLQQRNGRYLRRNVEF